MAELTNNNIRQLTQPVQAEVTVSIFVGNERDVHASHNRQDTFREFANHFKIPTVDVKNKGYFIRGIADYRNDENLKSACLLVLDGDSSLDNPQSCIPPYELHKILAEWGVNHFIYTTHSHTTSINKFRAVIPCVMICKEQFIATVNFLYERLNSLGCGIAINKESQTYSQPWFKANIAYEGSPFEFYEYHEGRAYEALPDTMWAVNESGEYQYAEDPKYKQALIDIRSGEDMHNSIISLGNYFASQGITKSFAYNFIEQEIRSANRGCSVIEERINALTANLDDCYIHIETKKIKQTTNVNSVDDLFNQFKVTGDDVKHIKEAEFIVDDLIMGGAVTLIVAKPGCGKTALLMYNCKEMVDKGYNVHYFNLDAPAAEIARHHMLAERDGYSLYSPHIKVGTATSHVVETLATLSQCDLDLSKEVIVIDTLKKCADLMSKSDVKGFLDVLRGLSGKSATVVMAGHTNKGRDSEDNLIYEGTGDVEADVDNLIYMEFVKESGIGQTITVYPSDKVRGIYKETSYYMDANTREISSVPYVDVKRSIAVTEASTRQQQNHEGLKERIIELVTSGITKRKELLAWLNSEQFPQNATKNMIEIMCSENNVNRVLTKGKGERHNEVIYTLFVKPDVE